MPIQNDSLPTGNLLLIDEHGMDARKLCAMLASDTLTVVNVNSSVQAFLAARSHRYDVVLARLSAREANPFRAFDLLQSHGLIDHSPFIYIAAEAEEELRQAAMNRGVDSIIMIPFSESDIRKAVAARIRRWRSHASSPVTSGFGPATDPGSTREEASQPSSSVRSIDASVVVRGACQAFERQRANTGTLRMELEKVRIGTPVTLLLRVVATLLRAVDGPRDGHHHIGVTMTAARELDMVELIIKTAGSPTGTSGPVPEPVPLPSGLEPLAKSVNSENGTLTWHGSLQHPAVRLTLPAATGTGRIVPLDRAACSSRSTDVPNDDISTVSSFSEMT